MLEIVNLEETENLLNREQLRHTGIFTAEPIALGGPDFFVAYLDRLREVTSADIADKTLIHRVGVRLHSFDPLPEDLKFVTG